MARGRKVSRVKLKIPSPEIEKKYLRTWNSGELYKNSDKFPRFNCEELFTSKSHISLEIGCGTGEFICHQAFNQPEKKFVGIEISKRAVYFAIDLAASKHLENILFVKADIKLTYPLMTPNSIEVIYLHFPDPYYGRKHIKHRIFDQTFLDKIYKPLIPNGKISIITDEKSFFFDMLFLAEKDRRFTKTHKEKYLTTYDAPIQSRFQRAWERADKPLFHFQIQKRN
jgi:tRNA (guanine-N7-)-methyltransferase